MFRHRSPTQPITICFSMTSIDKCSWINFLQKFIPSETSKMSIKPTVTSVLCIWKKCTKPSKTKWIREVSTQNIPQSFSPIMNSLWPRMLNFTKKIVLKSTTTKLVMWFLILCKKLISTHKHVNFMIFSIRCTLRMKKINTFSLCNPRIENWKKSLLKKDIKNFYTG